MALEITDIVSKEDWNDLALDIFEMLKQETKDLWEGPPDETFLLNVAEDMAEQKVKLSAALKSGNQNAIKQHKSTLPYLTAEIEAKVSNVKMKLAGKSATLLTKLLNMVVKTLLLKTISPT